MAALTIGRVAKAAGIGVETVRFYEREGLLEPPARKESGYRLYQADAVARLRFIRRAKELGFTLKEIRELFALRLDRSATRRDVRQRAAAKVTEIEGKIRDLERMKKTLSDLSATCHGDGPADGCPILKALGEGT
ncbi:MAG TPA: heavy metal-responsive transcriptional regulator [Planctomycetia bacterium]|nr:heavy metal-responsive transcriptional regulator [Planctomycetia bacterium]